jgi:hypothetical protein
LDLRAPGGKGLLMSVVADVIIALRMGYDIGVGDKGDAPGLVERYTQHVDVSKRVVVAKVRERACRLVS